jgi:hypothetical protein
MYKNEIENDEKPVSISHKVRNSFLVVLGAALSPISAFAWTAQNVAITSELTGSTGVSNDMVLVGTATVSVSIIPFAFRKLKSMLH